MSNPFLDLAKETVPYARRRKLENLKKVPTALEKKQADDERLHELWLKQFEEQKKALITGEWGHHAVMLCSILESLTIKDGESLIEMAKIWQSTNRNTRFLVLQLIDNAMVELRERNGLPPFDDPIPQLDEPKNAFLIIKEMLE